MISSANHEELETTYDQFCNGIFGLIAVILAGVDTNHACIVVLCMSQKVYLNPSVSSSTFLPARCLLFAT